MWDTAYWAVAYMCQLLEIKRRKLVSTREKVLQCTSVHFNAYFLNWLMHQYLFLATPFPSLLSQAVTCLANSVPYCPTPLLLLNSAITDKQGMIWKGVYVGDKIYPVLNRSILQ